MLSTIVSQSVFRASCSRATFMAPLRYNSTRFYSSTMHENDPNVLHQEKMRNLMGKQKSSSPHEHAPGWNETLASTSEANVKADRSSGSPSEMQSSTVEYMQAKRQETDNDNNTESTTAFYKRDEVTGPLSDAKGKTEQEVKAERTSVNSHLTT